MPGAAEVPSPEVPEWFLRVDGSGEGSGLTYLKLFTGSEPFAICVSWAERSLLHRVDVDQKDRAHKARAYLFVKTVTWLFSLAVTALEDTRRVPVPPSSILWADLSLHHSLTPELEQCGPLQ